MMKNGEKCQNRVKNGIKRIFIVKRITGMF